MFEFLIFFLVTILVSSLGIYITRLKNANLKLLMALNKTIFDVESLSNKFNSDQTPEREHLISFLNETRDIAYKYIEDVHVALLEYKNEIEYDLINPTEDSINKFREAFNKLQKIYPQDIPND
jgi:c-di-AMP phosphodiesterase-like protein